MEDGFHEKEVHWNGKRLWELEREMLAKLAAGHWGAD